MRGRGGGCSGGGVGSVVGSGGGAGRCVWGVWVVGGERGEGVRWVREGWAVSVVRAQCGRSAGAGGGEGEGGKRGEGAVRAGGGEDGGGGEGGEGDGGGWRGWSRCAGSNRTLLFFFIFWRSFLIS